MSGRVSVRLRFELPRAGRLFLVVRGPVPSCRVVAAIPVRGRKGPNTVDFRGRVAGRLLRPGTYALSLSTVRRPPAGAPATLVQVVSRRRTVPVEDGAVPTCAAAQSSPTSRPSTVFRDRETSIAIAKRQAAPKAVQSKDGDQREDATAMPPAKGDEQHDVLGIAIPAPFDGDAPSGAVETLVSIGILTLIGALLLAMVTLVTRFFRGTWNP